MVSAFIQTMRRRYHDLPQKHLDVRQADGSSTVYKSQYAPILEGSYSLYVNSVLKDAGVSGDYTIDLDTGDFVFNSAPTNGHSIELKYQSVNFRDQWWLDTVKSSIRSLGDRFFRTVVRSPSAITLSANVQVYDCPSGCIRPTEFYQSDDYTSGGNYVPFGVNHYYDRRSNKIVLGVKPTRANYTALSFMRRIALPEATSAVLDVEENWIEPLELKSGSIYVKARAIELAQQGNVSVEEGHLSVQQMRQLGADNEADFKQWKKENKPVMPAQTIPFYVHGGGDIQRF